MSKFCCITDLIRFMMKEAENLIKGSVHEDDFFIVHDTLVLMTAKETIEWMKEKNRIWDSKMGTPTSARIIEDVDLALKAFKIVYLANGASVEGLADMNGPRRKVVGEEKSVSWGGARTKGKGARVRTHQKDVLSQ